MLVSFAILKGYIDTIEGDTSSSWHRYIIAISGFTLLRSGIAAVAKRRRAWVYVFVLLAWLLSSGHQGFIKVRQEHLTIDAAVQDATNSAVSKSPLLVYMNRHVVEQMMLHLLTTSRSAANTGQLEVGRRFEALMAECDNFLTELDRARQDELYEMMLLTLDQAELEEYVALAERMEGSAPSNNPATAADFKRAHEILLKAVETLSDQDKRELAALRERTLQRCLDLKTK